MTTTADAMLRAIDQYLELNWADIALTLNNRRQQNARSAIDGVPQFDGLFESVLANWTSRRFEELPLFPGLA